MVVVSQGWPSPTGAGQTRPGAARRPGRVRPQPKSELTGAASRRGGGVVPLGHARTLARGRRRSDHEGRGAGAAHGQDGRLPRPRPSAHAQPSCDGSLQRQLRHLPLARRGGGRDRRRRDGGRGRCRAPRRARHRGGPPSVRRGWARRDRAGGGVGRRAPAPAGLAGAPARRPSRRALRHAHHQRLAGRRALGGAARRRRRAHPEPGRRRRGARPDARALRAVRSPRGLRLDCPRRPAASDAAAQYRPLAAESRRAAARGRRGAPLGGRPLLLPYGDRRAQRRRGRRPPRRPRLSRRGSCGARPSWRSSSRRPGIRSWTPGPIWNCSPQTRS